MILLSNFFCCYFFFFIEVVSNALMTFTGKENQILFKNHSDDFVNFFDILYDIDSVVLDK